ncbi:MAG: DnaD domain protein [Eubacteriaceae bacterium]
MNNFEFIINNDDLGVTTIDNIFINHYMPNSPGEFVKVYLLGLKYCQNNNLSSITNKIIAKSLNILESDVKKAWDYWQTQGIIQVNIDNKNNYTIKYYHIPSLMLAGKNINKNTSTDTSKDTMLKDMYKAVEFIFGRPLSNKELDIMSSWISDLLFTPEMIVLLVEYCFDLDKKDFNYLNKVALNWYDKKIKTYDEAMNYLNSYKEKWNIYYKIMNYLGFKRSPTKAETNVIDKWMEEYHMDITMIFEACKKTLAIDKPNLKYIDKILAEWFSKNYKTPKDILNESKPKNHKKNKQSEKNEKNIYDYDLLEKKLEEKMWDERDK